MAHWEVLVTRRTRGCTGHVAHSTEEDVLRFKMIVGHPIHRTVEWVAYLSRTPQVNEVYIIFVLCHSGRSVRRHNIQWL